MAQAQTVQSLLGNLGAGPEKTQFDNLKKLFWSELNYESSDQRIPTDQWTVRQKTGIKEIKIFAHSESQFGKFDIIHCRLDKLSRSTEREVITTLLRQYPYALFVFNDDTLTNWHFVNVKYAKDSSARPMLRRITVGPREQLRTASERIAMLDLDDLAPDMFGFYPLTIQERHDQAFDVEAVTNAFYHQYETLFTDAEKQIRGVSGDIRRLFTQRLFNRLMFVRFVERKGWLSFGGSSDYLRALWKDYLRAKKRGDTFYTSRLSLLFFAGLNTPNDVNIVGINPRGVLQELIGNVPYLNGGLFEKAPDDYDTVTVPDEVIEPITDGQDGLFYRFNFTVTESTPFDIEVAVDPEMLGKIFEELVTGRHESGSYYTPKAIVSFMGREAIRNYLQVQCPHEPHDAIAAFVDEQNAAHLSNPEAVLDGLKRIKICDPACGSGAYLLGMMQELLELRRNLFAVHQLDAIEVFNRKLEIIQNNLYGVDVDPFAVQIARLRLWLSLIVDFEGEKPLPLPNLDYKVECGNSLTAPDPSGGLQPDLFRKSQIDHYRDVKACYLNAHGSEKKSLRDQIEAQRKVISQWLQGDRKRKNTGEGFDWAVEFTEVFNDAGFDIILANPPYVRADAQFHHIRDVSEQQATIKQWKQHRNILKTIGVYTTLHEKWDLYIPFLERAIQLLRSNGQMVFIIPDAYNTAKYAQKSHQFFLQNCTVNRIDFCSEIAIFDAGVFNTILNFSKSIPSRNHCPMRFRHWGDKPDDFSINQQLLPAVAQGVTDIFRPDTGQDSITGERYVRLDHICYISVGMVINADEDGHQGEFDAEDLVTSVQDKRHPKRFIFGKDLDKWTLRRTRYLEWGTLRAPHHFRRPTFPELHEAKEKLIAMRTPGVAPKVIYDDDRLFFDASSIGFIPWHYLTNVRNRSIEKSVCDDEDRKSREIQSRCFHPKFILAIMNSAFIRDWLRKKRRSIRHIYPDDWKAVPIPSIPKEQQQYFVDLVDAILNEFLQHGYPLPEEASMRVRQYEESIDECVAELFEVG